MQFTPKGDAWCKISLPSDVYDKVSKKNITTWVNIVIFGTRAEWAGKYLAKGSVVSVSGPINVREYTTKDGRSGVAVDMIANLIEALHNFGVEYVQKAQAPIDDFNQWEAALTGEKVTGEPF